MELSRIRFDEDDELLWEQDGDFAGVGGDEWVSLSPNISSDRRSSNLSAAPGRYHDNSSTQQDPRGRGRHRFMQTTGGPCLLPIRLSRSEALRFRELVKYHAVSVSSAARLAPSKSATRFLRRQQLMCDMWYDGLQRLERSRGEAQLIAAFGDLRRLVVAEGARYFLQHNDRTMLVEAARRIRARDKYGGEQKIPNGGGN